MAEDTTSSIESVAGVKNGQDLGNGEYVVYDFDEDGQYVGWHKAVGGK